MQESARQAQGNRLNNGQHPQNGHGWASAPWLVLACVLAQFGAVGLRAARGVAAPQLAVAEGLTRAAALAAVGLPAYAALLRGLLARQHRRCRLAGAPLGLLSAKPRLDRRRGLCDVSQGAKCYWRCWFSCEL
jgi:hypothetical protein